MRVRVRTNATVAASAGAFSKSYVVRLHALHATAAVRRAETRRAGLVVTASTAVPTPSAGCPPTDRRPEASLSRRKRGTNSPLCMLSRSERADERVVTASSWRQCGNSRRERTFSLREENVSFFHGGVTLVSH